MPLSGITIIDLTRVLSGPFCTMVLADLGSRVIKVERPGTGDDTRAWGPPFAGGESTYFLSVNRNKESLSLDFRRPEGRTILERLLATADVIVENFRPGTLARYGLDYPAVANRLPHLIYCSISGYGQTGPRRGEPGYDAVIQAEGGLMSITGDPDGPPFRLGLAISDMVAGLFAAQGITAALFERARTGRGRHVDVALLDSVAALLTHQASAFFATGTAPPRFGNGHQSIVPYDTFMTSDGPLMLAVGNDDQWRRFCTAAGLADLADDPRFRTNPDRVRHRDALQPVLEKTFRARPCAEWATMLKATGVPCGPVRNIAEALADPQLEARAMIAAVPHATAGVVRQVGNPIVYAGTPRRTPAPAPSLGEHTATLLMTELGLSAEDVRDLRARDVI